MSQMARAATLRRPCVCCCKHTRPERADDCANSVGGNQRTTHRVCLLESERLIGSNPHLSKYLRFGHHGAPTVRLV